MNRILSIIYIHHGSVTGRQKASESKAEVLQKKVTSLHIFLHS